MKYSVYWVVLWAQFVKDRLNTLIEVRRYIPIWAAPYSRQVSGFGEMRLSIG